LDLADSRSERGGEHVDDLAQLLENARRKLQERDGDSVQYVHVSAYLAHGCTLQP